MKSNMLRREFVSMLTATVLLAGLTSARLWADDNDSNATAPDNTRMNSQNAQGSMPTADQAQNNRSDQDIMRSIRKAIMQDKSLSVYGHNVKIIAQQGKVTLKGTVHTDVEKTSIGRIASDIAGDSNVTNRISVKGS